MKIYNSLTRQKEEFKPIRENKVGMYVCGPTVYDEPHIGHARSAYNFDVVRRYLKYKGFYVLFVRNVTDVDDKIIDKARKANPSLPEAQSLEAVTREVSELYLGAYHRDMGLLGITPPDKEPKATEYIPKMIKFIELLIDKGSAYPAGGDVYFDIKKAKNYGKLSNQDIGNMEAGARISPGESKRDPLDFALWKKAKEGEPSWDSPWGKGRPGWHIECSAMSSDILGDEFDIHGGGIDLIFPHHENEVAQSEGAGKKFARYWIHNGLLTIDSEKMAKSLGNFITIQDFLKKYGDGDYLKLLFLSTHYRHPVDYTTDKIEEMKKEKERFVLLFDKIERIEKGKRHGANISGKNAGLESFRKRFEDAMDDDFNTPLALAALFDLVTYTNKLMHDKSSFNEEELSEIITARELLSDLGSVLGLTVSKTTYATGAGFDEKEILVKIKDRNDARKAKDFKRADDIRKDLEALGVILEDTKDGTIWRRKA
ncbi:MAG: cysteine--tRNA ligase [Candidatus Omnitrophica bacterium]|nr:cysteine--tRNA ligase [Candidatus Omnitrophota bacterium]